jgi:hypothetical protein
VWQRDNAIGAVVSVFVGGAVRDRDSIEGGSVWRRREKKAFGFFAIFRNGRKREREGLGLKFFEDKIVFFIKFIQ